MTFQARLKGRSIQVLRPTKGGSGPKRWQTLIRIPKRATRRTIRPVAGKAQRGVEYHWRSRGKAILVRIHDPDPSVRPTPTNPQPNALVGWVVRVSIGKRFMDAAGRLHARGKVRPKSHLFDEVIANETHIPIFPPAELT